MDPTMREYLNFSMEFNCRVNNSMGEDQCIFDTDCQITQRHEQTHEIKI